MSIERVMQMPTSTSGLTPVDCRWWASWLALAFHSW